MVKIFYNTHIVNYRKQQQVKTMNAENNNKKPLFLAINSGKFDIASQLIDNGSDVNMLDTDGNNALLLAVSVFVKGISSTSENVEKIINQPATGISKVPTDEALDVAKKVSNFIEKSLGIDEEDDEHNDNETQKLTINHEEGIALIKKILTAGSNINAHNNKEETALMIAMMYNNADLVELLTKYGAR